MAAPPPRPTAVRLYGAVLRLLPPGVRRADAAEMESTFADLWSDTPGPRRLGLGIRMFGRLPAAIAMEWLDAFGWTDGSRGGDMGSWWRHLTFGARTLGKAPAFTVTTVLLIGLGVGAFTTIFTLVDHVLLRPLPYPAADRLVTVEDGSHSGIVFHELEGLDGVELWAGGSNEDATLTGQEEPLRIEQARVTEDFFALFGGRPAEGRLLVDDDFRAADVVVVSHATWRTVFGSDPGLVGRTLRVDGVPVVVIGVLDASFEPPQHLVSPTTDVYRPVDWSSQPFNDAGFHTLEVAGRLAPGADPAAIQERLDVLAQRLADEHEEMRNRDGTPDPLPLAGLHDSTVRSVRGGLGLLLGAVGLLLLVACLNVAHLFLARGLGRVQEMAVRRALGAGPAGILKQLLVESLMVGLAGGVVGLGLAWLGLAVLGALNPYPVPRAEAVALDLRVVAFATAVSCITAIVFGLLPALRTVGGDVTDELRGASRGSTAGRGTQRLRSALVVVEVALSLVLLAEAGLLLKSFARARAPDPGLRIEGVWTIPLKPTGIDEPSEYLASMDAVLASLQAVPGVASAAYGLTQPFEITGNRRCCWNMSRVEIDGEADESLRMFMHPVSDDYFETLGIDLVAGAAWTAAMVQERPVPAVVTERLAIDVFGSAEAALGHVVGQAGRIEFRVIGVATDVKHYGLDQPDPVAVYLPISVIPFAIPQAHMAVRLRGEAPDGLDRTLRQAIWRADPELPVTTVRPLGDWISASVSERRFDSVIFGTFGAVALLLAAAGLYGTLLYTVRQRRRELGIRMALGAARARVERQVVGRGVRLALIGSVLGIGGALWVGRLLEGRLFEVRGGDPTAVGGAALVLIVSAALASWLPARRAGRTDPMETLKAE